MKSENMKWAKKKIEMNLENMKSGEKSKYEKWNGKIQMNEQAAPGGRTPTMQSNLAILSPLSSDSSR